MEPTARINLQVKPITLADTSIPNACLGSE